MVEKRTRMGIMHLRAEVYHYICITSFERAFKLNPNSQEFKEFRHRMLQLETAFRNTEWEEAK